jgi:hypothetical protein
MARYPGQDIFSETPITASFGLTREVDHLKSLGTRIAVTSPSCTCAGSGSITMSAALRAFFALQLTME